MEKDDEIRNFKGVYIDIETIEFALETNTKCLDYHLKLIKQNRIILQKIKEQIFITKEEENDQMFIMIKLSPSNTYQPIDAFMLLGKDR